MIASLIGHQWQKVNIIVGTHLYGLVCSFCYEHNYRWKYWVLKYNQGKIR